MWRRIAMIVAWVVATLATAAITLAAVGQAGDEVSDRPAVPVSAEDLAAQVSAAPSSSSTSPSTTTSLAPTTTAPPSTTSTSLSTPTTGAGATSSSSTVPVAAGSAPESRTTPGGTVTVIVEDSVLYLSSAVPAQGFDADIESEGTTEIEVKFEKHDESVEYIVRARLEDGEIHWEIRTEAGDD